ncbi:hypothetical protein GEV33_006414 [Tenebrio molitor]|uniref:Uncharacterized protein n=1 Tax=Tenebrio molitor TaxID=7067 RepID=A0A8J6HL64_TENMO|nr:hypothetical protein GEV33_006414 [Tenebrio molitor]
MIRKQNETITDGNRRAFSSEGSIGSTLRASPNLNAGGHRASAAKSRQPPRPPSPRRRGRARPHSAAIRGADRRYYGGCGRAFGRMVGSKDTSPRVANMRRVVGTQEGRLSVGPRGISRAPTVRTEMTEEGPSRG